MTSTHCMLDLETWGTKPGCAIRSIGAVMFDPFTYEIGEKYYANIDRTSCERWGLKVEAATEAFWREQAEKNPAAVNALHYKQFPLSHVVPEFNVWWARNSVGPVWAQGINFDEPIWRVASEAVGLSVPWNYKATRDTRTIFWLAGFDEKTVPRDGPEHHALFDAIAQAKAVQAAIRHMQGKMVESVVAALMAGKAAELVPA